VSQVCSVERASLHSSPLPPPSPPSPSLPLTFCIIAACVIQYSVELRGPGGFAGSVWPPCDIKCFADGFS